MKQWLTEQCIKFVRFTTTYVTILTKNVKKIDTKMGPNRNKMVGCQ